MSGTTIDVWNVRYGLYRPLYLPLVATVVLDSISVSTSVVTGAPVHVVRVVLDGLHLLLTPHPSNIPATPTGKGVGSQTSVRGGRDPPVSHSVCILDVDWLELTLKHCNNALLGKDFEQVLRIPMNDSDAKILCDYCLAAVQDA